MILPCSYTCLPTTTPVGPQPVAIRTHQVALGDLREQRRDGQPRLKMPICHVEKLRFSLAVVEI
jgi:hypothetical protein